MQPAVTDVSVCRLIRCDEVSLPMPAPDECAHQFFFFWPPSAGGHAFPPKRRTGPRSQEMTAGLNQFKAPGLFKTARMLASSGKGKAHQSSKRQQTPLRSSGLGIIGTNRVLLPTAHRKKQCAKVGSFI